MSLFQLYIVLRAAAGEDAAKWLTEFLGKPVRLVRYVGKHLITGLVHAQQLKQRKRLSLYI